MRRPNILIILNDDMGFSDLGCYGGEIHTPNLDRLAAGGLRYTQFYNTARCCPSRACLLTGLHPHQADIGHMTNDDGVDGYLGDLNAGATTIAEVLGAGGYGCYMTGKWHVTKHVDPAQPLKHNWPLQRGFDQYYGILHGCGSYYQPPLISGNEAAPQPEDPDYYFTDDLTRSAIAQLRGHFAEHTERPFFQYLAYTAPHWPLHAPEAVVAKYKGRFDEGWDALREQRLKRMVAMGLLRDDCGLTARDPRVCRWEDAADKEWQTRRMEVYAAQVEIMDRGIGRVVDFLEQQGQLDNTLILFLADNGGCAEDLGTDARDWFIRSGIGPERTRDGREVEYGNIPGLHPGGDETYQSYGIPWANLSNTPFRLYKHWVHEGGIATPLIAHWPAGMQARGEIRTQCGQLPDIMATCLEVSGAAYPTERQGNSVPPCEGFSLAPTFRGEPALRDYLFFEHEGNRAVRRGQWKLVCEYPGPWELYDMSLNREETHDVIAEHPDIATELASAWETWARRCGVRPWDEILEMRKRREGPS